MAEGSAIRSVAQALQQVGAWRDQEKSRCEVKREEVDREIDSLRDAISNLELQVAALQRFQGELDERAGDLDGKTYEAVFEVMSDQARALAERAAALAEVTSAAESTVDEGEDVRSLLEEYRSFKTKVEPTLSGLPVSYRGVLQAHHDQVVSKLQRHFEQMRPKPPELPDAEPLQLDLLYAIDAPDGDAELLMFILPVHEVVHTEWDARPDGLELTVGALCVAAVYGVLADIGQGQLMALYGGHRGLIAVEAEVEPCDEADVMAAIEANFSRVLGAAPELVACRVVLTTQRVPVDDLFPPDEEEEEEGAAEAGGMEQIEVSDAR